MIKFPNHLRNEYPLVAFGDLIAICRIFMRPQRQDGNAFNPSNQPTDVCIIKSPSALLPLEGLGTKIRNKLED